MIARAFGRHCDALMREEVKGFLFDVHRQTQGHSQLVTGGGTTATRHKLVSISLKISQSPSLVGHIPATHFDCLLV